LVELGIDICPATSNPPGRTFEGQKFFKVLHVATVSCLIGKHIFSTDDHGDLGLKAEEILRDLQLHTHKKLIKKRTLAKLPLILGEGIELQVGTYVGIC